MLLKPKELPQYLNTTNEGTRENPKVEELEWEYKLALYLGFALKWDYDYRNEYTRDPYTEKQVFYLTAVFKLSHDKFDSFWCNTWDSIMDDILPKMREDNLITKELESAILGLDRKRIFSLIMDRLDKHVPDMSCPFKNVTEFVEKRN